MKDQEDKKVNLIAMQYEYSIRTSIRSSELYEYLIEKDWTLHFLCVEKKMNINAKIHNLKKVPFFVKSFPYLGQAFFKIVKIYNYNGKCAILTWSLIESYLGLLCVHFCKDLKVISFIRGDSYEVYELSDKPIIVKKVGLQLLRYIEKQVLSKANRVVFLSEENQKRMLYRSGINRKLNIDIIYNNINTTRIEQLSQEDKPFLPFDLTNNRVIGFVGNLSLKVKGIENLIIAFSELKKIIDNVRLLLVGEGADKEEILKLCEKYLISDDVFFLGFQKNPIKFMKLFDLLVLPSNSEAFGYVLLESIYVGTPAIGSRVGGIPEVLKYEELLFEPNDWNSLYEKLKNILCCDEEYKKVKDLCIKRKDFFTFNWCEKMEESINRTLLN